MAISERSGGSGALCAIAKRRVYDDQLSNSERSNNSMSKIELSSKSPIPRARRKGSGRLPAGERLRAWRFGHSDPLSNSARSYTSPKRQKRKIGRRLSISECTAENYEFDEPLARFPVRSRSDRSPLGRRRQRLARSPMRTRRDSQGDDVLSNDSAGTFGIDDSLSQSDRSTFRDDGSTGHFSRRTHGRNFDDSLSVSERMIPTSEYEAKMQSVMDGLTINKLQYDKVGLVGREREAKILRESYERLTDTNNTPKRKELVFVHGYSGVGKSTLVSSMLEACDKSAAGFCARGKFDFSSADVPYTAIASAFDKIFEDIERNKATSMSTHDDCGKLQTLGESLAAKVGPDTHLLATMIPKLKLMIPESVPPPSFKRHDSNGFEANQKRWEYALRVLTRELNKIYSPLVLFLDDVHWADQSSLNLIECLISDVENENPFMVVGCYRSNAVGIDHILSEKHEQLENKKTSFGFNLSQIEIGNLDKEGVHDVVLTLLSMDHKKKTESLADVCFRRTLGNPFFLIEFMTMLSDENLLKFSLGSLKWSWEEDEIERETMSTENVVDIVHLRMKKLSKNAQQVLEYAACLGSTIRVKCLSILMSHMTIVQEEVSLSNVLHQLEKGGFIEQIQLTQYRWAHDNVRETALMLGDAASQLFQFEVGNTLFRHLDDDELDELLFEVCDLINRGKHGRRVEFAKLNLRAAQKAKRISAFHSARTYATKGVAYLQNDKWKDQHNLTLQLFTLAMEMELAIGRIDEMENYAEEILIQPSCTAKDKIPKLPKGFLSSLQPVVDPNLEAAMDLLVRLSISSYIGKNIFLHIMSVAKMVQMTLKHGVHSMSGYSFMGLGTCLMIVNGDTVEGASFAKMADDLQKIVPDEHAAASTTTVCNMLVLPWTQPLQTCRASLKEGYASGMVSGNSEMAMLALFLYSIVFPLMMGKPLASIVSKCATIAAQCEELKLGIMSVSVRQFWELILELMDKADRSVFSNNDILQEEGWEPSSLSSEYIGLQLAVYSGEYEIASKIALKMGDGFQKANPGNVQIMSETFLRAVALYAGTSNLKSKRAANNLQKKMGNFVKKGNPNVGHCYHLLCAEKARLDGKYEKANALYNDAVVLAARTGHVHHAALSNERYAGFLLCCMKDKEESDYRIKEAIRFYKDWGAERRVRQLTNQLGANR
ncbi:MAG: hypothetical protein SGBAC_009407 [Bacillariaceae sp.]